MRPDARKSDELLTVRVRYKDPQGSTSRLLETPVKDRKGAQASEDMRFASAVAGFALLLRDSEHAGSRELRPGADAGARRPGRRRERIPRRVHRDGGDGADAGGGAGGGGADGGVGVRGRWGRGSKARGHARRVSLLSFRGLGGKCDRKTGFLSHFGHSEGEMRVGLEGGHRSAVSWVASPQASPLRPIEHGMPKRPAGPKGRKSSAASRPPRAAAPPGAEPWKYDHPEAAAALRHQGWWVK